MNQKSVYQYTAYHSPVGQLYLLADSNALVAVGMREKFDGFKKCYQNRAPGDWDKVNPGQNPILKRIAQALDKYFKAGEPLPLDVSMETGGTPFQRKVWKQLQKIPQGKTLSYGQVAEEIGSPGAARAVGSACAANPIPLFIPCHRVVGTDGKLCGFGGGGVGIKRWLLEHEQNI